MCVCVCGCRSRVRFIVFLHPLHAMIGRRAQFSFMKRFRLQIVCTGGQPSSVNNCKIPEIVWLDFEEKVVATAHTSESAQPQVCLCVHVKLASFQEGLKHRSGTHRIESREITSAATIHDERSAPSIAKERMNESN